MAAEIERIVDRKLIRNRVHYLVVWRGFDAESNTWCVTSYCVADVVVLCRNLPSPSSSAYPSLCNYADRESRIDLVADGYSDVIRDYEDCALWRLLVVIHTCCRRDGANE